MSAATASIRLRSYLNLGESVMNLHRDDPSHLKDAMRDALRMLDELNVPFALFGAHAVAVYLAEHRSTEDIDFVVDESAAEIIQARAHEFGFRDCTDETNMPIRKLRHRCGARLDLIFDTTGFASLDKTIQTTIPDVGVVPVACIEDIAYSKLRTQRSDWPRDPQKQRADYNDLVALLSENPALAPILQERVQPPPVSKPNTHQIEMAKILFQALRDAGQPSNAQLNQSFQLLMVLVAVTVTIAAIIIALIALA